jgi:hypothetical protein
VQTRIPVGIETKDKDMTQYKIQGYKKGTEQAQVRVDAQASRGWVWSHGHTLEDLLQIHAQPDFDPDTHLYCYLGDEMVGYVDADIFPPGEDGALRAWLEYPRALPGHHEAIPLLLERSLHVLQDKGVDLVVTRGATMWPGSFELIESLGFQEHPEHKRGYKVYYVYDLGQGALEIPTDNVFDFDPERDLEGAAELATHWYNRPVGWCRDRLLEMEREWPLIAHLVVREGDDIVAACSSAPNLATPDGEPAAIYYIYVPDAQYLRPLVAKTIERCIQAGRKRLLVDLIHKHRGYEADYQEMGFTWAAEWARYEKRLENKT